MSQEINNFLKEGEFEKAMKAVFEKTPAKNIKEQIKGAEKVLGDALNQLNSKKEEPNKPTKLM